MDTTFWRQPNTTLAMAERIAESIGATLFPHNVGLGAAHDPDLIQRIGEATA